MAVNDLCTDGDIANSLAEQYDYDYDYEMVLLRHTISTMYHGIIFKSCKKNSICYNEVCHRRTNKESVLSADVGPPETNIIYLLYNSVISDLSRLLNI